MIGKNILHYKILKKLGEGGMGVVYLAEDTKLKQQAALKFLHPYISANEDIKNRFEIEALTAASINHPNITTIYGIEKVSGEMFIVMEYIKGKELKNIVQTYHSPSMPLSDIVNYAIQIAEGLEAAHKKGIIHRDIKPSNIMITNDYKVKIMDFGLAKINEKTNITKAGTIVGTVNYMSPEQIIGENIDQRSDIWSFGVVLFEILTGSLPFRGKYDAAMMYSIVNEEPKPIQKHLNLKSSNILYLIGKCLKKDADERYQTMQDIITQLLKIQRHNKMPLKQLLPESLFWSNNFLLPVKDKRKDFTPTLINKNSDEKKLEKFYWNKKIILSMIFIIIFIFGYLFFTQNGSLTLIKKSLAVLPFKNLNPGKSEEYFCDGITEDITIELSQISNFRVIAYDAVMKYKNSDVSIKDIGNNLGVASILEGTIQKEGNKVRIDVKLVDVNSGEYLWKETYDKELTKIFDIQSDVSKQIAYTLKSNLTLEENSRINKKPTDNITAYQYYLKGREYYYRYHTQDNEDAIQLFKQALKLDSNYALAYAGLGDCYCQKVQRFGFSNEWYDSSITAGKKAIMVDPNLAEGYKALALVEFSKGLVKKALEINKKAVKINPNFWPAVGNIDVCYEFLGNLSNAIYWGNKMKQLNPVGGFGYTSLARVYILLNDYKNAEKNLNLALSMQPDLIIAYDTFSHLHFNQGKYYKVIQDNEKIKKISSDDPLADIYLALAYINLNKTNKALKILKNISSDNFYKIYADIDLAFIYKKLGNINKAEKLLRSSKEKLQKKFIQGSDSNFYAVYMFLNEIIEGNKVEAYKWISKAINYGFRDYMWLMENPITKNLQNEKKFKEIIQYIKDKVQVQQIILTSKNNKADYNS